MTRSPYGQRTFPRFRGVGLFRAAQLEHSAGEQKRAEQTESRARHAYEVALAAFAGGKDLGGWQKSRLQEKLKGLATMLHSPSASQC